MKILTCQMIFFLLQMISLEIHNFRSIDNYSISFNSSGTTLLSGKSGVGKTTIFEAIRYALFGGRNYSPRSSPSSKTSVTLSLPNLVIYRQSKPGLLKVNDLIGDIAQDHITSYFGSLDSWIVCCYLIQGEISKLFSLKKDEKCKVLQDLSISSSDRSMTSKCQNLLITSKKEYETVFNNYEAYVKIYNNDYENCSDEVKNAQLLNFEAMFNKYQVNNINDLSSKITQKCQKRISNIYCKIEEETKKQESLKNKKNHRVKLIERLGKIERIPNRANEISLLSSRIENFEKRKIHLSIMKSEEELARVPDVPSNYRLDQLNEYEKILSGPSLKEIDEEVNELKNEIKYRKFNELKNELTTMERSLSNLANEETLRLCQDAKRYREILPCWNEKIKLERLIKQYNSLLDPLDKDIDTKYVEYSNADRYYQVMNIKRQLDEKDTLENIEFRIHQAKIPKLTCPKCSSGLYIEDGKLVDYHSHNNETLDDLNKKRSLLLKLNALLVDKIGEPSISEDEVRKNLSVYQKQYEIKGEYFNIYDTHVLEYEKYKSIELPEYNEYCNETRIDDKIKNVIKDLGKREELAVKKVEKEKELGELGEPKKSKWNIFPNDLMKEIYKLSEQRRKREEIPEVNISEERAKHDNMIKRNKLVSEIKLLRDQLGDFEVNEVNEVNEEVYSSLKDQRKILESDEKRRERNDLLINELEDQIKSLEGEEPNDSEITKLKEKIEKLQNYQNKWVKDLNIQNEAIKLHKLSDDCLEIERELNEKAARYGGFAKIKEALMKGEHMLLDSILMDINVTTNEILGQLFEDPITITLKSTKELKTVDNIKNEINISITYHDIEFDDMKSLSGGEQSRVSLALTIAFATFSSFPMLILDESLSSLDVESKETAVETIKTYLPNKIILFVNHDTTEGIYDSVINI